MLKCFYNLADEVAIFMDMKGKHVPALKDKSWLCDLAFLVDVTTHLNEVNTNLQKQGQLVHELYGHIKSFEHKLRLWESQLKAGNTYHFPTLASESNIQNISQFADELKDLRCEFNVRFQDFRAQEVSLKIFASPFDVDVETAPLSLQMELIDSRENFNLKITARDISLSEFYQRYFPADKYPKLGDLARKKWHYLEARMSVNNSFQE